MKEYSYSKEIITYCEEHPLDVFSAHSLHNKIFPHIQKQIISTVLGRLYAQKKLLRSTSQLQEGFIYSKENKEELDNLFEHHLFPYTHPKKRELILEINKNKFERLKERDSSNTPINLFLAKLVAFTMGDGHISRSKQEIQLYFRYKIDAMQMQEDLCFYFPEQHSKVYFKKNYYLLSLCYKDLAEKLILLGSCSGSKTKQPFSIPDWIFYGSDDIKKAFLSTIYGNEGSAPWNNKWRIQFVLSKYEPYLLEHLKFLNQIRTMLCHFGIETSHIQVRKQPRRAYYGRFYIKGKENIYKFYREFSFLYASEKQEALELLIYNDSRSVEAR